MRKTLLLGMVALIICSFSFMTIFAEEITSDVSHDLELSHQIEIWIGIAHWLTGVGTVVLAIALIKTFKHMEAVTKLTTIETNYRLRPWIGPVGPIKKMEKSINDDCQFDVTIKNFGELAANAVTAKFVHSNKPLTRESLQSPDVNSYDLGPVMPTMEKHYWFFINSELWQRADSGTESLFTALYFEYFISGKKSGYGMLSEYNPAAKNFIHKDMWID